MELNTIDKFLLLAHHPLKGRLTSSQLYSKIGCLGAAFLELVMLDRITIKKSYVYVNDVLEPLDSKSLNNLVDLLKKSKKPKRLKTWLLNLSGLRKSFLWMFIEELAEKGIVRIENKKFLWFIPYKNSYLVDTPVQQLLISEFKNKVYLNQELNDQDVSLLGLIDICKLYSNFYTDYSERKVFRKKVKTLLKSNENNLEIDNAIKETINEILSIIVVLVISSNASSSS